MQNSTSQIIPQSTAPIKSAVICLMLAWFFALLPIPFISFGGMIVFNIAAFILAILCMSRNSVKSGIGILAGSLIGTPIMYFIGLAILAAGLTHSLNNHDKGAAHQVRSNTVRLHLAELTAKHEVAVYPSNGFLKGKNAEGTIHRVAGHTSPAAPGSKYA